MCRQAMEYVPALNICPPQQATYTVLLSLTESFRAAVKLFLVRVNYYTVPLITIFFGGDGTFEETGTD